MRITTYNIHGGTDAARHPALPQIAQTLAESEPDVILLQEVDRFLPRSQFQDQAAWLAKRLGMSFAFFGRLRFARAGFGNALLCREPLRNVEKLALPGGGEPRAALSAHLGSGLIVWNTHLGLRDDWRVTQMDTLARALESGESVVLGGDFNTTREAPEMQAFLARTGLSVVSNDEVTFPVPYPTARIDFLLARGMVTRDAGTIEGPGSDHCLVWAALEPEMQAQTPAPPRSG